MEHSAADRHRTVTAARSLCWEAHGKRTERLNDIQCLLRAASWTLHNTEDNPGEFLDTAEELASEIA